MDILDSFPSLTQPQHGPRTRSRNADINQRNVIWLQDASQGAPPPADPNDAIRAACDASLEEFLRRMFPQAFPMAFSPTHLRMINEIQRATIDGGLKAIAAPRGTGKTSILLRSALWALITEKPRQYVTIVAADEASAQNNLNTIKAEIQFNEQLGETYALETWLLRQIRNEPRRVANQHFAGTATGLKYSKDSICFGTIPADHGPCASNGAVITVSGITGRIRGQQAITMDGKIIRPDFVLVDDPSTKLSAASLTQNKKRHETMMGDILGLSGPGIKISGFCSCTVIYKDDLADRLLDRQQSADWNGDKVSMIQKWPKNMALWEEYNQIRIEEFQEETGNERSQQFVRDNYDKLHEDAQVYWEDRKSDTDVSALQHAMDLYFRDPSTFAAEFQNAPMEEGLGCPFDIQANTIARRTCGYDRAQVPDDVDKVTAFIDVQNDLLYYMVCAWTVKGRCHIIDYGAAPDQQRHHWTKTTVQYTLAHIYGDDFETYLRSGIEWLIDAILTNEYTTEAGAKVSVDRLCIDGRWGESTKIVRDLVRECKHRARVNMSMGMYVGVNSKKWQQLKQEPLKKGQKYKKNAKGIHAKFVVPDGGGRKELMYDTNYWKSMCAERLLCPIGSPKAIVLFEAKAHIHLMFGEHCAAEEPIRMIGKANNVLTEWKQPESGVCENDLWDCLVGNAALASTLGVELLEGNRRSSGNRDLAKALERVRQAKPGNQFFRSRK